MYAIKTEIIEATARVFDFQDQKTMYGGKKIAAGNAIYLFASENQGGAGLVARGIVVSATETPGRTDVERQTPRVSVAVSRTAIATPSLGRKELERYANWSDGRPETELNFRFYRHATGKIVGISAEAAAFLEGQF